MPRDHQLLPMIDSYFRNKCVLFEWKYTLSVKERETDAGIIIERVSKENVEFSWVFSKFSSIQLNFSEQ